MTRQPRKRGPSIREQIRAELGGLVIDGGEYGPEAKPEVEMCWQLSVKASGGNSNGTIFSPRCRRGAKMSLALRRHRRGEQGTGGGRCAVMCRRKKYFARFSSVASKP